METFEDMLQKIIEYTGKSRDEVISMINQLILEHSNLLTPEGAAMMLMNKFGLDKEPEFKTEIIRINNISLKRGIVSTIGRVLTVSDLRNFIRKSGEEGQVRSIILYDKNDRIRVVFWDEKAHLVDESLVGQVIKVLNVHPRKDRIDKVELHSGSRTTIDIVNEDEVDISEFPMEIQGLRTPPAVKESIALPISEITEDYAYVTVTGVVTRLFPVRSFTAKDGSIRRVASVYLVDKSLLEIRLTIWEEQLNLIEHLEPNMIIKAEYFAPRRDNRGEIELHSTFYSKITINPEDVHFTEEDFHRNIALIEDQQYNLTIKATILQIDEVREYIKNDGTVGRVRNVLVQDPTGEARLVAWDEKVELFDNLKEGDIIKVSAVRSKITDFGKDLILSRYSKIERLS